MLNKYHNFIKSALPLVMTKKINRSCASIEAAEIDRGKIQ